MLFKMSLLEDCPIHCNDTMLTSVWPSLPLDQASDHLQSRPFLMRI